MPNLLSLPGELRNEIYIACFDITFDRSEPQPADIHSRYPIPDIAIKTAFRALPPSTTDHARGPDDHAMMPTFTYPPRLLPLLQLNRQIHREASSLFYQTYLPLYRPTFHSFSALRAFTANLPGTHARHLRGTLQMTKVNLGPELRAVGLVDGAPQVRWRRNPSTSRVTTMRTDCFLALRYRPPDLQYDQLSMYGHLGRIRWRGEKMVLRRPMKLSVRSTARGMWEWSGVRTCMIGRRNG